MTKYYANPAFLRQPPGRQAKIWLLCTLWCTGFPLLIALPAFIYVFFTLLFAFRAALVFSGLQKLPVWGLILLMGAAAVVVYTQTGSLIGRDGGMAFLLFLVMVKTFESSQMRDWQVLLLVMPLLMGGAMLFNQSILMAPWLLLSVLMWITAMGVVSGTGIKPALSLAGKTLLLAVLPAAVLFVSLPRKNEPLWRIPQRNSETSKSGLSDTMKPGSISNVVLSNEPVFSVTFDDGVAPERAALYWRVLVMDRHNGSEWTGMDDHFPDMPATAPAGTGEQVSYREIVTDDKGRIPALDYPLPVFGSGIGAGPGATVRAARSREGVRSVHLQAQLTPYLHQPLSERARLHYTRLPARENLRTRALAKQLAGEASGVRDYVQKTLAYFRREDFRYTLQPQRGADMDTTDFFLFDSREGFCEDYTDAFVWLMRAAGVPARVISGYQGGEYNAEGRFWQIRGKDAHAWAEVWLPDEQVWWRVDPTSAVSAARVESGIAQSLPESDQQQLEPRFPAWDAWTDRSRFYWQQWVVNFDGDRQNSFWQKLVPAALRGSGLQILIPAGLLAAAFLPLWLWWRRQNRRRPEDDLTEGLEALKAVFADSDPERTRSMGADGLADYLRRKKRLTPELAQLLDDYLRYVYADAELPAKSIRKAWRRKALHLARKTVRVAKR